ncbi:hypothetical protein ACWCWD_29195 [Streptomyces sp. NPDC001493]
MADSLLTRYMAAHRTWRDHSGDCTTCQPDTPCKTGRPLYERFADLQDAYLRTLRAL